MQLAKCTEIPKTKSRSAATGDYADFISSTHPAPPPSGERAALIEQLHKHVKQHDSDVICDTEKLLLKAAEMLAADAQWRKLSDPVILHANLLRGLPAKLSKEQLLHLLGTDIQDEWHRGRAAGIEECERVNAELKKRVNE